MADWQEQNLLATQYLYRRLQDLCLDYVEAMEPSDRVNAMSVCMATLARVINNQFVPMAETIMNREQCREVVDRLAEVLARNRDYHCQSHGMAQQVRNAASSRGISVTVETREKSLIVRLNCQS